MTPRGNATMQTTRNIRRFTEHRMAFDAIKRSSLSVRCRHWWMHSGVPSNSTIWCIRGWLVSDVFLLIHKSLNRRLTLMSAADIFSGFDTPTRDRRVTVGSVTSAIYTAGDRRCRRRAKLVEDGSQWANVKKRTAELQQSASRDKTSSNDWACAAGMVH